VPPGGGRAGAGEDVGARAGGTAQVRGVEAGDGGFDARRQIPRVVVEHLGQAMPGIQRAVRGGPQRPDVVASLMQPVVGFPRRAPTQVLVGVDQRAPAQEGPLPDLLAGDRVRDRRRAAGPIVVALAPAGRGPGTGPRGARLGWCLVQRDEVRGTAATAALVYLGLGHHRQVELGPVGELGEDPPDPLVSGPGPVP
jgi:hypothetical protein